MAAPEERPFDPYIGSLGTRADRLAPLSLIATTKPILAITSQGLQGFDTFQQTQLAGAQTVELNKSTVVFTENANLQSIALYGRRNTLRIADGRILTLGASGSGRSLLFDASIDALGSGYIAVAKLSGAITGVPSVLQAPRLLNCYVTAPVRFAASQGNALTLDRTRLATLTNDSQDVSNVATVYLLPGSSIDSVGPNINVVQVGGGSGTPGTARDPLAIGDNAAVVAAVKDASNTWAKGDLTAYGSQTLQNAGAPPAVTGQNSTILVGTADVVTPDEFSGTDSTGSGWNYRYFRRNDGTSGWTRTPKG